MRGLPGGRVHTAQSHEGRRSVQTHLAVKLNLDDMAALGAGKGRGRRGGGCGRHSCSGPSGVNQPAVLSLALDRWCQALPAPHPARSKSRTASSALLRPEISLLLFILRETYPAAAETAARTQAAAATRINVLGLAMGGFFFCWRTENEEKNCQPELENGLPPNIENKGVAHRSAFETRGTKRNFTRRWERGWAAA